MPILCVLTACGQNNGSNSAPAAAAVVTSGLAAPANCENPITVELAASDKKMELSDIVDGTPGEYVLVGTKSFVTTTDKSGEVSFLSGEGTASDKTIDPNSESTTKDLAKVVCHNNKVIAQKTNKISGSVNVPAAISTLDGTVVLFREDEFRVKDSVTDVSTRFYPRREKIVADNKPPQEGLTVLVARKPNQDVVVRFRSVQLDKGTTMTISLEATYRRK